MWRLRDSVDEELGGVEGKKEAIHWKMEAFSRG